MKNFVVIPTYNEKENIKDLIGKIISICPEINILIVDDNSPDGTASEVEELMIKIPNLSILKRSEKNGLGEAYIEAFKKLIDKPDIENIIMMDGDFSHNPKYLPALINEARKYGLVIGSRYIGEGGIDKWELWRRFLSIGGNFYVRLLLGTNIKDWTGGFNCINSKFLKNINFNNIDLSGYAFIMGLKYSLIKSGAKAKEIPIVFEARRGGESKLSHHIISEGIIAPWKIIWKK